MTTSEDFVRATPQAPRSATTAHLAIVLGTCALYILSFGPLYGIVGTVTPMGATFPVLLSAVYFGAVTGALVGLATFPLNVLLVTVLADGSWTAWAAAGGAAGTGLTIIVAYVIGRQRELLWELAQSQEERQSLSWHRDHLEDLVKERNAALRNSEVELQRSERLASLGTLAAGIAHEINNPVGTILLAAGAAARRANASDGDRFIREALQDIERDAIRCGEIVRGVLQFAREEHFELTLQAVTPVVEEAIDLTRPYAHEHGATITVHTDPSSADILMNRTAFRQAMVNILRNAVESGGSGAQVAVEIRQEGAWVQIAVTDRGAGLSPDEQASMFDPFYTTRREQGGTGLGLSLTHGIVSEHQGKIEVTSAAGSGTTVTLMLPTAVHEPAEDSR